MTEVSTVLDGTNSHGSGPWAAPLAGWGLPGCRLSLPSAPLVGSVWTQLLDDVADHRLAGLLGAAIAGGDLPVTPDQLAHAADVQERALVLALRLERVLLEVVTRFRREGIEYRVMKGVAAAHLIYQDPGHRCFGDLDLLVRGADFDAAVRALIAHGMERVWPELRPGFDRRFGKGTELRTSDGLEVDLHRMFVDGRFGLTTRLDDLFQAGTPFAVGGVDVLALGAEHRFLVACFNAALGDVVPRLSSLRDIAQMNLFTDLDQSAVRAAAADWRAEAVLARAVALTWRVLDLTSRTELSEWARSYRPSTREERILSAYTAADRNWGSLAFGGVRVIPGARAKLAYLRALFLPRRELLAHRHQGVWSRWRHGARLLAGRAPR